MDMSADGETFSTEIQHGDGSKCYDEDGHVRRIGTWLSASAHIITAVIGSGVLSLAWAVAQIGWVAGPAVLVVFSFITYFTSVLLADCYRSPDPITGKRNYTYMDAAKIYLGASGDLGVRLCGVAQYTNLIGATIGYTITSSISMVAVSRANCFHQEGHQAPCAASKYPFMLLFAAIEVVLSQIHDLHKLTWLSTVAAAMSFAYSSIGLGLSVAKVAGGGHARTSLTGVAVGVDVSAPEKVWRCAQAIGDIAFAYTYTPILIEIQDTLKSSPPENETMKKATLVGVSTTTLFYLLCGCVGYAAFGNDAPGNFLTGFGFYEPFWLIDFANVCIAVHLIGAYQVYCQPVFGFVESMCAKKWPQNSFIIGEYAVHVPSKGRYNISLFRLVLRTTYVVLTALVAMIFPFFNDFLGLIGAVSFWPLTVYFPIEMHIARTGTVKYSRKWIGLKMVIWACLLVSLAAAVGSVQGLVVAVQKYKPFQK